MQAGQKGIPMTVVRDTEVMHVLRLDGVAYYTIRYTHIRDYGDTENPSWTWLDLYGLPEPVTVRATIAELVAAIPRLSPIPSSSSGSFA